MIGEFLNLGETMVKEIEKNAQAFLDDMIALTEKYKDRLPAEEVVVCLQTIFFTMVMDIAPTIDEASEFLHDSVDEFIEKAEEMLDLAEEDEEAEIEE